MLWPFFILVFLYGACIGSFLNVVIYRLPEGRSLVSPGSHCPKCSTKLAWYDNVPVLGWLWLRGRCRYCRTPISAQYPMVELVTGLFFAGLFAAYYWSPLRPEFSEPGLLWTWPALIAHLTLLAGLIAATVIDARLYIIPLQIPWFATAVAVVLLPLAAASGWLVPPPQAVAPEVGKLTLGASLGALAGLLLALALLQASVLPRSFNELEDEVANPAPSDSPEAFLAHPHPRREVLKECLFLLFPIVGAVAGAWVASRFVGEPAFGARVLGGVLAGYFIGAALVWFTRVLGTLAFGKEAMGLGDVHLLGAIGAVLGGIDVVFVFFTAPFFGLLAAVVMAGVAAIARGQVRIIPYGPYLAGAAVVVMLFRVAYYVYFEPLALILRDLLQF